MVKDLYSIYDNVIRGKTPVSPQYEGESMNNNSSPVLVGADTHETPVLFPVLFTNCGAAGRARIKYRKIKRMNRGEFLKNIVINYYTQVTR